MMPSISTIARCTCAFLTALTVIPVLAGHRMDDRQKRTIWWILAVLGILAALLPLPRRLTHSNLAHYYIGAKYRIPYFDFYRVIKAARGEPQIGYRDLQHPHRMFRSDVREQRFYYLDLLNRWGAAIPDQASNEDLARLCESWGLFQREADKILAEWSQGDRAREENLRADLARMRLDSDDNGFNGSPFYVMLRYADPSLYVRFGWHVAVINILWQFAALFLALHLTGVALGWSLTERAFAAAIFLCSWDYSGWALNGLSFGGWLLPLTFALYGWRKQKPAFFGLGLAWSVLLKIFPFVLILPIGFLGARAFFRRWSGDRSEETVRTATLALSAVGWTAAAMLVLVALSLFTKISWVEFLRKIIGQFQESVFSVNTVGLAQVLLALGIPKAPLPTVLTGILLLCATGLLIGTSRIANAVERLAHVCLLIISALGWILGNWFNYYALISLLLLPNLLFLRPRFVGGIVAAFAIAYALPDFDRCYLDHRPLLALFKALPCLILPVWAIADRLAATVQTPCVAPALIRMSKVFFLLGFVGVATHVCHTVYRIHSARAAVQLAETLRDIGQPNAALAQLIRAWQWSPNDALLALRIAEHYSDLEQYDAAAQWYGTAVRRAPDLGSAWTGLGILAAREGQTSQAIRFFARAVQTTPHDEIARYNYAVALQSARHVVAAIEQAQWAVWLRPDFPEARHLLEKLSSPKFSNRFL